jgi:hypothetical protein
MISRLRVLTLLWLSLCSGMALADAPIMMFPHPVSGAWIDNAAMCAYQGATNYTAYNVTSLGPSGTNAYCQIVNKTSGATGTILIGGGSLRCWDGSAPNTSQPTANQCSVKPPPPPDCSDISTYKGSFAYTGKLPGSDAGCAIVVEGIDACWGPAGSPATHCDLTVHKTGVAAPAGTAVSAPVTPTTDSRTNLPPSPSTSPSGSCPAGSVQGGIDSSGIPICIGTGTAPKGAVTPPNTVTKAPVVTNGADGTTTTVETVSTTNADGSVTTRNTTTAVAADGTKTVSNSATTSTTSTGAAGAPTNPGDQQSFCAMNPMLAVCRDSAVSGTCETVSCDGDAIQCATLRAAAAMECKGRADTKALTDSSLYSLGVSGAAGNDPMKGIFPSVGNATVVQAPSSLDDSGWLGGGSCFADKSFVVMGKTIVMPFSKTCDSLLVLRYALMVVAALVSFKIISGAVLS